MGKYRFLVMTNPVAGHEGEYHDWYNNRHLADIVAISGFAAAQRFALQSVMRGDFQQDYLAVYELDARDLAAAQAAMNALSATEMEISPALDGMSIMTGLFELRGDLHDGTEPGPYRVLTLTDAADGWDEAFSDWHATIHIRETMAASGCTGAESYRQRDAIGQAIENQYAAFYSLAGRDWPTLEQAIKNFSAAAFTSAEAGREDRLRVAAYQACSPRVSAPV